MENGRKACGETGARVIHGRIAERKRKSGTRARKRSRPRILTAWWATCVRGHKADFDRRVSLHLERQEKKPG
jgi:hypothetical protein